MAYDQPGNPAGEQREREERGAVGRGSGKEFRGGGEEEVRTGEDLRRGGGGRSNKEREGRLKV